MNDVTTEARTFWQIKEVPDLFSRAVAQGRISEEIAKQWRKLVGEDV